MAIYIGSTRYKAMVGSAIADFIINSDMKPYKTVVLDSAHEADNIANPSYWSTFLEIPVVSDNTDRNLYLVVFEGNTASTQNYRVDFAMYYRNGSNNVMCSYIRNNRGTTGASMSTMTSLYASVGTVIKCYKIETT